VLLFKPYIPLSLAHELFEILKLMLSGDIAVEWGHAWCHHQIIVTNSRVWCDNSPFILLQSGEMKAICSGLRVISGLPIA